ncbi:MAG: hypothetical protein ILA06_08095 [Bacteroidaceae bacterium]|nr:hypothetical protein [Bacteroidaceae bacterium]
MKKKTYSKPVLAAEHFVPQDAVAACAQPTHWVATCRDVSCLIFDGAGPNDWTSDMNRGGCGKSHEFTLEGGLKPEANCWLLLNVRTRQPGTVNVNQYPYRDWFESTGNNDGSGYVLKESMISQLKATGELVPGYYNDHILGSNSMLVTDDIANIKNPS